MTKLGKTLAAFALFVGGCAGMNEPGGFLSSSGREKLLATTQQVDTLGKDLTFGGFPLIGQAASALAALGGGVLLLDKTIEQLKRKKNATKTT